jgi:hypothetical protein
MIKMHGAAMLLFVLFFAFATSAMMLAFNQSIFIDLQDYSKLSASKQVYLAAESILEDMTYRHVFDTFLINQNEMLTIGPVKAYGTTTYDTANDVYEINTASTLNNTSRKAQSLLTIGGGSSFNYGLQAGNGGITLANSSQIIGNVYSNGTVEGAGSAKVQGDIVSAGPSGLVKDIRATSSIFANTIDHIITDEDAHYNVQIGSNAQNPVGGVRYTPVTNQPVAPLPIDDAKITEWKDAIVNNGTMIAASDPLCASGTYTIDTSISIGYLKVECNLDIRKTGSGVTVTLTGPVWVQGNLSFTQGPVIRAASSLGRRSVQFIADNPSNRLTSSKIEIRNSTQFYGSGDYRSFVMLLSMNNSAANSGTVKAIDVSQSANGALLVYTNEGLVDIGNGIHLKEVTGYKIKVAQNSTVRYETGLASLLFTSGPGGGYRLTDWQQIR